MTRKNPNGRQRFSLADAQPHDPDAEAVNDAILAGSEWTIPRPRRHCDHEGQCSECGKEATHIRFHTRARRPGLLCHACARTITTRQIRRAGDDTTMRQGG